MYKNITWLTLKAISPEAKMSTRGIHIKSVSKRARAVRLLRFVLGSYILHKDMGGVFGKPKIVLRRFKVVSLLAIGALVLQRWTVKQPVRIFLNFFKGALFSV